MLKTMVAELMLMRNLDFLSYHSKKIIFILLQRAGLAQNDIESYKYLKQKILDPRSTFILLLTLPNKMLKKNKTYDHKDLTKVLAFAYLTIIGDKYIISDILTADGYRAHENLSPQPFLAGPDSKYEFTPSDGGIRNNMIKILFMSKIFDKYPILNISLNSNNNEELNMLQLMQCRRHEIIIPCNINENEERYVPIEFRKPQMKTIITYQYSDLYRHTIAFLLTL